MYKLLFKRFIDIWISILLILVLLPLFIITSVVLYLTNSGSIFYIQLRPGKNDQVFHLIKFKTMDDKLNNNGILLSDNERITKIGRILRMTSIDELPQLINVLKGEMSLVGPRPLLIEYIPLYNKKQANRHKVKPGMTGLAQVSGRNWISWEEKLNLDVWYVEHFTFFLDIKILYMTILKVLKCEGINSIENLSIEPFKGDIVDKN
jgi:undecaprenyl phosphate N,N'-diacetylbacillosamine 1-phosphate transferase